MSKASGYFASLFGRRTQALPIGRSLTVARPPSIRMVDPPMPMVPAPPRSSPSPVAPVTKPANSPLPLPMDTVVRAPSQHRGNDVTPAEAKVVVKKQIVERVVEKTAVPRAIPPLEPVEFEVEPPAPLPEPTPLRESPPRLSEPVAPAQPVAIEHKLETIVVWPPQLNGAQRTAVRQQVERTARERVAVEPRAKTAAAQKVEIRVDQVNVRLDVAPQPPPRAPQRTIPETGFGDYFFHRSLR